MAFFPGGGGAEGPGGCLRRSGDFLWGGGGAKYFFSGPKCPLRLIIATCARTTPIIEISPPRKKPLLETPENRPALGSEKAGPVPVYSMNRTLDKEDIVIQRALPLFC